MNWEHDDLAADLAAHLRGASDRLVWTDMQLGPAGSPRPDVYTVPCSFARFMPIAYECKISVADFRRDVTAGKWTSYLQFAAGVIFAAPAGLINKMDVPPGCGLMIRGDTGWRSVKGPTLKAVGNLPRDAWIKLIIDGIARLANEPFDQMRAQLTNQWKIEAALRERMGAAVADALQSRYLAENRFARATADLEKAAAVAEDERRKIIESARDRAREETRIVDEARVHLAQAVGLEKDASPYEISAACRRAARRLDADEEIRRLRKQLETVKTALDNACEPLPAIAGVAA